MFLFAALALTTTISHFNAGPVDFDLDADLVWHLSLKDNEVEVDLDTVSIRGISADGSRSTAIYPFRGGGKLPLGKRSDSVTRKIWPEEWMRRESIEVDFDARRPNNLWHQRVFRTPVTSHTILTRFSTAPGQAYILIPNGPNLPKLTLDGKPVSAYDLAYRRMVLRGLSPGRYYDFSVDGLEGMFRYESDSPPLAHPWFDAILSEEKGWSNKTVYVNGRTIETTSLDQRETAQYETQFKSLELTGIYILAKPRDTIINNVALPDETLYTLQPALAVFRSGSGQFADSDSYSSETFKDRDSLLNGIRNPNTYCPLVILSPTRDHILRRVRTDPPNPAFAGSNQKYWSSALRGEVRKGMTMSQVRWILGEPLDRPYADPANATWTYRIAPPGFSVTFKNGQVTSIYSGRLP